MGGDKWIMKDFVDCLIFGIYIDGWMNEWMNEWRSEGVNERENLFMWGVLYFGVMWF